MDIIILFFIANLIGYIVWRIENHLQGYAITHLSVLNLLITILFFLPLKFGGYLDIESEE